jgi:hypothetical protein
MTGQLDGRLSVRWLAGKTASRRLASCNDCQQGAGQLNSTAGCGQLTEATLCARAARSRPAVACNCTLRSWPVPLQHDLG